MKRFVLPGLLALLVVHPTLAETLAFTGVHLITMNDEQVLADQTLVIEEGVIKRMGQFQATAIPEGARVIDAQGQYLMPGLAEMHAHIPNSQNRQAMEEVLTLYLSQGITTIRGMLGEPGHLTARSDQQAGRLHAPRIIAGGPSLNGNSVRSARHGVELVEAQHQAGYDHLKIHPGLDRERFDAIAGRAVELDMMFAGHVSPAYGAMHAINQGQNCIDHLDGFISALIPAGSPGEDVQSQFFGINLAGYADPDRIDDLARSIDQAGAWVVPTETLMVSFAAPSSSDELLSQPGMDYVASGTKNNWRQSRERFVNDEGFDPATAAQWLALRRQLIKSINDHGQRLLLGSDAPQVFNVPGFSIHRELAIYVSAGLSPRDALASGTINVARYQGLDDRRGRIAAGFDADLVLLKSNPLEDIDNTRSVQGVVVAGRWYDRSWLDARLAAIAAKHAD